MVKSKRVTTVKVEKERTGGEIERMNMIKVNYIHVWKYHNDTPFDT
jgi:hypothetical protein